MANSKSASPWKSPCGSDGEEQCNKPREAGLIEVEFPHVSFSSKIDQQLDVKINIDIEIIKPKSMFNKLQNTGKSYELY